VESIFLDHARTQSRPEVTPQIGASRQRKIKMKIGSTAWLS